jgi:hypothetical protein
MRVAGRRMDRVSRAVSTRQGRCSRPGDSGLVQVVAAVDQSGTGGPSAESGMLAMITGSPRSVLIAYCGSKCGPGPIRETGCGPPPGA